MFAKGRGGLHLPQRGSREKRKKKMPAQGFKRKLGRDLADVESARSNDHQEEPEATSKGQGPPSGKKEEEKREDSKTKSRRRSRKGPNTMRIIGGDLRAKRGYHFQEAESL